MSTDLTFLTNEEGKTLGDRFDVLLREHTRFFDCLVGYFYICGFHRVYKSLEKAEKVRILIGISTNKTTIDLLRLAQQTELDLKSHAETKQMLPSMIVQEMEESEESAEAEQGIHKFIEWIKSGKLEIRAYPSEKIHAKVYIMTFVDGHIDVGRVITGSSNLTQAGLQKNLEFNVELKNRTDYEFAKEKFDQLWANAVDVKDKYIDTIRTKTWLNNTITPYQLYLKFLYEYFKDEVHQADEVFFKYIPTDFKRLEYQEQAVLNAKKILQEYGGVFLSDVVGLGKTYMAAMLANQMDGRNLVLAPPVLLDENNPGSWPNVFSDFKLPADYQSLGKLDKLARSGVEKYKNIIIDEAHRFRTETNVTYETLAQVCRGKRIILVTATPYNNSPKDVLSQIKLFQKTKKSTIPNMPDLESFFSKLDKRIKGLDRQRDHAEYIKISKENARDIREKVLKYLMVRRTRTEIENFFKDDLKNQGLKFPAVKDPEPVLYELNQEEDAIFNSTIRLITQKFKYARYTPLLYYEGEKLDQLELQSQRNMGRFMKILLVKRLESSFHAFRNSVSRFIASYKGFLQEFENGSVYVSKKHMSKIFELLENDDIQKIQDLIDQDKARKYSAEDFSPALKKDLEDDLKILKEIEDAWSKIKRDPKLLKFKHLLSSSSILKKNKIIVFTESKETADYLAQNLEDLFPGNVISFTGSSSAAVREKVIENFDAKSKFPKDDYRILISTEVLSEGVNLHRSNVVINYDIPWNPTRLMQRVGRINRVDTGFDKIYTFNFFPTKQSNDEIKLKEAAEAKIHAFISLLGADARLLTEGETIESHELFNRLVSGKTITGEDDLEESELKYLQVIRNIRDKDPDLFAQIKCLPKKARTARKVNAPGNRLLTYFRKGKLDKFFMVDDHQPQELDFIEAAKILEVRSDTTRAKLGHNFYELLEKNKDAFASATMEEIPQTRKGGGRDSATQLLGILKAIKDYRQFTDEQELYLTKVMKQLEEGGIPRQTAKTTMQELNRKQKAGEMSPLKLLAVLQKNIAGEFLESHFAESSAHTSGPREVILSEYLLSK